jgi:hypothetical protein
MTKTRYKLLHELGSGINNFPSKWIADNHPHRGERYIVFHEMYGKQNCPPTYGSSHALYFGTDRPENEQLITGLKFSLEFPHKTYGVYKNDALLIQFSEDWNKMTIWVFEGKGEMSYSLFQEWVTEDLTITVETDDLPLSA